MPGEATSSEFNQNELAAPMFTFEKSWGEQEKL